MKRVIVAGGGPAGMMAAITAARQGASVTLLEAMERTGKKLLLTGNGRCNLTHIDDHPETSCFGASWEFISAVMERFSPQQVCDFFQQLGLLTTDRQGYVYPVTGQSSSVHGVLLTELHRLKVKVKCSEKIISVQKKDHLWQVRTDSWCYEAEAVILACGSKAVPKTGSDGSGYDLARMAGHRILPVYPALAPVFCQEKFLSLLAGVRCRAFASLYTTQGKLIRREYGELQWISSGVSGILIFQLSRFIAACPHPEQELYLELDLLPDTEEKELLSLLKTRAAQLPQEKISVLLAGILHEKMIPVLLQAAGISKKASCQTLTEDSEDSILRSLIHTIKHLRLVPTGTRSFEECQVCQGGVDTSQVNQETLESKLVSDLYFAGEMLDVDGLCGGYNLQWAWASGYTAGLSAASHKGVYNDPNQ